LSPIQLVDRGQASAHVLELVRSGCSSNDIAINPDAVDAELAIIAGSCGSLWEVWAACPTVEQKLRLVRAAHGLCLDCAEYDRRLREFACRMVRIAAPTVVIVVAERHARGEATGEELAKEREGTRKRLAYGAAVGLMKGYTTMEQLRASLRWLACHASAPTGLDAAEAVSRTILGNAPLVWSSFRHALELPSPPESGGQEAARRDVAELLGMFLRMSVGNPFRRLAVLRAVRHDE